MQYILKRTVARLINPPVKYSIIIIAKNELSAKPAVDSLKNMNYDSDTFEIIVSTGHNPSLQRNKAVSIAKGEWLLFLDNDSKAFGELLDAYDQVIAQDDSILAIGGPTILQDDVTLFEKAVNEVFIHYFGVGPIRSRYMSLGQLRKTDDKELILCNLMIRKTIYSDLGGLNPLLYPNEENFFLNRLKEVGEVYYDPNAVVYRGQRANLLEFAAQMLRYGEGRTKQFRLNPRYFDAVFVIPFSVVPFYFALPFIQGFQTIYLIYMALILWHALIGMVRYKSFLILFNLVLLYPTCHLFYSLGLWKGLWSHYKVPDEKTINEIKIVKVDN